MQQNSDGASGRSPKAARRFWDRTLVLFALLLPAVLAYLAFSFTPTPAHRTADGRMLSTMSLLGGSAHFEIYPEVQMFLFVALLGGFGGALSSFRARPPASDVSISHWFSGVVWCASLGSLAASVFYFLVRAGAFTPDADVAKVNALGMAVLAVIAGLAGSSLLARLQAIADDYLNGGADTPLSRALKGIDDKFDALLANPVLDNWSGVVAAEVRTTEGIVVRLEGKVLRVWADRFTLAVAFLPEAFDAPAWREPAAKEDIAITGGKPPDGPVVFEMIVDGEDLAADAARKTCEVPAHGKTPAVTTFGIAISDRPAPAPDPETATEPRHLIVTIRQKGVLVQSLVLAIERYAP